MIGFKILDKPLMKPYTSDWRFFFFSLTIMSLASITAIVLIPVLITIFYCYYFKRINKKVKEEKLNGPN